MSSDDRAPASPDVLAQRCSLSGTLDLVGERWTLLLLREALLGATRFSEFRTAFPVASNLLTTRLGKLVAAGLMARVPYQDEGQRVREGYALTPAGTELAIAIGALQQWGDKHLRSEYGPVASYHSHDGRPVTPQFVDEDGRVVDAAEVTVTRVGAEPAR